MYQIMLFQDLQMKTIKTEKAKAEMSSKTENGSPEFKSTYIETAFDVFYLQSSYLTYYSTLVVLHFVV